MPSLTKIHADFVGPLSSGTPAAPILKFSDSSTTGIFSPNTGEIAFSTSGQSQAVTFKTDGKVGIGINSPVYNLDVIGDINFTGTLRQNGSVFSGGGGGGGGGGSNWTTSGNNIYRQSNVGINQNNPTDNLEILHTNGNGITFKTSQSHYAQITSDVNRTGGDSFLLALEGKWNGTPVSEIALVTGSDTTNKDDGEIIFRTSSQNNLASNERLRITSTGLVGINIASPATVLDIKSTKNDDGLTVTKGSNVSAFLGHNGSGDEGLLLLKDGGATKVLLYGETNQNSYINSGGNFGIGTNDPSNARLKVVAAITQTFGSAPLAIFGSGFAAGYYSTIGFGPTNSTYTITPVGIGYLATSQAGGGYGDLVFGTRNVTTNTAPTERLRITSAGSLQVKGDTNPNAVFDRGSANTTNVNFNYNGTLTGQLGAANAEFQISAAGASTPLVAYVNGSERFRITSGGKVRVPDNGKFTAGAGDDLQIYHTGSHSFIVNSGVGSLYIRASAGNIQDQGNANQSWLQFNSGAGVEAHFAGNKKFETTSTGVTVTGTLAATAVTGDGSGLTSVTLDGQSGSYYTGYTDTAIANLVDSSPGTLNTLNELAAALGDDASFSTTVTNSIATKLPLAGGTMTGTLNMGSNNITTTGKVLFANMYSALGDLPSASTYHGMFAHVHGTGKGYFAHGGNWIRLLDTNDEGSGNGLDADTVDGQEGSYYLNYNNFTNTPTPTDNNFTTTLKNKLDGIEASATADQTAAEILTAIKTVDGASSGLDSDTLDGLQGSVYLSKGSSSSYYQPDNWIDFNTTTAGLYWAGGTAAGWHIYPQNASNMRFRTSGNTVALRLDTNNGTVRGYVYADNSSNIGFLNNSENWRLKVPSSGSILRDGTHTIWDAGNDGAGSGLDADTLDGLHASSFITSTGRVDVGALTVDSNLTPTSGTSMEIFYGTSGAVIQSYDRDNSNLEPLRVRGSGWDIGYDGSITFDNSAERKINIGTEDLIFWDSTNNKQIARVHYGNNSVSGSSARGYSAFVVGEPEQLNYTSNNTTVRFVVEGKSDLDGCPIHGGRHYSAGHTRMVAVGRSAITFSSSTGSDNTACGALALYGILDGQYNTALGTFAGSDEQHGDYNVFIGSNCASHADDETYRNTVVGAYAAYDLNYDDAVIIGAYSAYNQDNSNSDKNTYVGAYTAYSKRGGGTNTLIGYQAGRYLQNGNNDSSTSTFYSNTTCLGYDTRISGSNQVQLGNSSTTSYAYGAVQNRSDARDKTDIRPTILGLDFIKKLNPVDFRWDYRDDYTEVVTIEKTKPSPTEIQNPNGVEPLMIKNFENNIETIEELRPISKDGSKARTRFHHGLIAQDVKTVMDELDIDFAGYQDHNMKDGLDVLSIGYTELIGPMIKAIQEQQAQIEALTAMIESMK